MVRSSAGTHGQPGCIRHSRPAPTHRHVAPSGRLPIFQAGHAGSIPIARSARTFRPAAVPVAVRSAAPIRARYQIPWWELRW